MSILIKNMKIPSSCTMCWLNTFCGVWNEEPVKNKGFNERLENCPLTELIRCKDCVYFTPEKSGEHWNICRFYDAPKTADGYCNDAEPKEAE